MPEMQLDAIDRKILALLQHDGRMSLAALADKVGLSPSPCLRRVRLLEKAGVIARYVAVLDQRAVGLPVRVFVSIKLESQREEALDEIRQSDRALAGSAGMLPDDRAARLSAARRGRAISARMSSSSNRS